VAALPLSHAAALAAAVQSEEGFMLFKQSRQRGLWGRKGPDAWRAWRAMADLRVAVDLRRTKAPAPGSRPAELLAALEAALAAAQAAGVPPPDALLALLTDGAWSPRGPRPPPLAVERLTPAQRAAESAFAAAIALMALPAAQAARPAAAAVQAAPAAQPTAADAQAAPAARPAAADAQPAPAVRLAQPAPGKNLAGLARARHAFSVFSVAAATDHWASAQAAATEPAAVQVAVATAAAALVPRPAAPAAAAAKARRRSLSAAVGALMRLLGSRSAAAAAAGLGALRPASLYDSYRRPHYYPDKTGSSLAGDSPSLPSVELPPPAPAQASSVAVARSTPAGAATVVSHALEGPLHAAPARQAEARAPAAAEARAPAAAESSVGRAAKSALAAAAGEEPAQLRTELGATVNLTLQRRLRRHATGEAPLPPMDLLAYVGTLRLAAARLRQAGCPAAAADLEAIVAHHSPPDPLNEEQWASFSDFSRLAADFERELKGGPFPAGGAAGGDRSWRSPAERHAAVQLTAAQRDAARRVYAQDEFELAGDETRCDWSAPAPPPACSLRLAGRGGAASAAEQIIAAKAASDDEAAKKPWLLPRVRAAAQAAVEASAAGQTGSAGQPAGTAAAVAWAAQWAADNVGSSPVLLASVRALAQREFGNAFLAAAAGAELAAAAQAAAERRAVVEMAAAEMAAARQAAAQQAADAERAAAKAKTLAELIIAAFAD